MGGPARRSLTERAAHKGALWRFRCVAVASHFMRARVGPDKGASDYPEHGPLGRVGPASVLVAGGTGPHADTPAHCQVDVIPPHLWPWPPPETQPTARIVSVCANVSIKELAKLRERICECGIVAYASYECGRVIEGTGGNCNAKGSEVTHDFTRRGPW